jgi:formylglycine-generating enzyme required for sulfatase activity
MQEQHRALWEAAARCHLAAGKPLDAGRCLERAGKIGEAAAVYEASEAWADAARCHEATGAASLAAACHERAGAWEIAARCYEQSDRWQEAAWVYAHELRWPASAETALTESARGRHGKAARAGEELGEELVRGRCAAGRGAVGEGARAVVRVMERAHEVLPSERARLRRWAVRLSEVLERIDLGLEVQIALGQCGEDSEREWESWTKRVLGEVVRYPVWLIDGAGKGEEGREGYVEKATGTRFEWIEGGRFWMGSADDDAMGFDEERPRHEVEVWGFWCMAHPVTRRLWQEVMGPGHEWWPEGPADDRPVNNVSWFDAVAFCNVLSRRAGLTVCYRIDGEDVTWSGDEGYRLLSEAEWEYACRAGSEGRWCFGDDEELLAEHAWYQRSYGPHPAGVKLANAWGLHDMHGNVWEWCWDWYAGYSDDVLNNPRGPAAGVSRVLRGGSFAFWPVDLRSAVRYGFRPRLRSGFSGLRCARGVSPTSID